MFCAVKLLLLLTIIWLFGRSVTASVLRESRRWAAFTLSGLFGLFGYALLLNTLSYLVPIRVAALLVPAAMLVVVGIGRFAERPKDARPDEGAVRDLTPAQVRLLAAFCLCIAITSGLFALHSRDEDVIHGHLPFAATMVEGNFPVKDPMSPDHAIEYHYAPELVSTGLTLTTGLPVWLGYDVQVLLFSGLTVALAFLLAFELVPVFQAALVATVCLYFGGSLEWAAGIVEGVKVFWQRHEGMPVNAPWTFLATMSNAKAVAPLSNAIHNLSAAGGFPLTLLVLYLIIRHVFPARTTRWLSITVLTGLLLGHLALHQETNFGIVVVAVVLVVVGTFMRVLIRRMHGRADGDDIRRGVMLVLILAIGIALALTQGGVLQTVLHRHDRLGASGIGLSPAFWIVGLSLEPFPIFSFLGFVRFGLAPLLLIPALVHFRKRAALLFLALVACGAFAAPLLFVYKATPHEFVRFFPFATALFALIVALWLWDLSASRTRHVKTLAVAALMLIPVAGFINQAVYMIFPFGKLGKLDYPYIAAPPAPKAIDVKAYDWIRAHTSIQDRFMTSMTLRDPNFKYDDAFIRDTGRFEPGYFYDAWGYADEHAVYHDIVERCAPEAIRKLGIRYVYLSSDAPAETFERFCRVTLPLAQVYADRDGTSTREIYRIVP